MTDMTDVYLLTKVFEQLLYDAILPSFVTLFNLENGCFFGILFSVAELEEDVEPLGIAVFVIVEVVALGFDGKGEHVMR